MPESSNIITTFQVENRRNTQNYVCHEKGLARIYDGRFADAGFLSELDGKECKFPAGFGWRLDEAKDCSNSSPKETKVVELIFDSNYLLKRMSYTYEKKKGRKTRRKNDYYEYEPEKGRTLHKKYK